MTVSAAATTVPAPAAEPDALPFRREKVLAVGLLAALAPIPLAFTASVDIGKLVLYLVALGALLAATYRGRVVALGNRTLNVIGLAYLAFFVADLKTGAGRLLPSAIHLLLFTTVVKLASIKKERDFSVAFALAGFLFLGSVATSFHVSIVLFAALFVTVAWPILVRWALWRDLAAAPEEWRRDAEAVRLPGARAVVASVAALLLVACGKKAGSSCKGTESTCLDKKTALACRGGKLVSVSC
ncbi:MAG TPA: hypothetical protein VGR00_13890, partial [Thermoanaerobaculia bacterium]|nr:hypothetical protein [Thermoanaerobaculia bacterium]